MPLAPPPLRQLADLAAVGVDWDGAVVRQSERFHHHEAAIAELAAAGLTYECFCTRREIRDAASAPHGPDVRYPGTCRDLSNAQRDVRRRERPAAIRLRAPGGPVTVVDRLAGSYTAEPDDVVLEVALAGAVGWISGYTNAFPETCVDLYRACMAHDLDRALPLYRLMHPLLRWDSKVQFVQAIKLSMDMVGRYGGPSRPPRYPLTAEQEAAVRRATDNAVAAAAR